MVRTGEVVEQKGGISVIVFERPQACTNCNGCMGGDKCTRIELPLEADVGDTVSVEMPDQNILSASAMAYLIPVALLLIGLIGANLLHTPLGISMDSDMFSAIWGISLAGIGILIVTRIDRRLSTQSDWQPKVLSVHKKDAKS